MCDRILKQMCDRVRSREFLVTTHADEELDADGLTVMDLESAILTGKIVERQRDRDTIESKYLVRGNSLVGDPLWVVAKISPTGKWSSSHVSWSNHEQHRDPGL